MIGLLLVLLAQSPTDRPIADGVSSALVGVNLTASIAQAWRQPDRKHALGCLALRNGIEMGATETVKRLVHKTRPDGSDQKSFWSGHTASATVNAGWSLSIGIPIAVGAGAGRIVAKRHDWIDVMAGAGAGLLASRVCKL